MAAENLFRPNIVRLAAPAKHNYRWGWPDFAARAALEAFDPVPRDRDETAGARHLAHVVAKASEGIGLVSARLDMGQVARARALIPVAQHRVKGL